MPTNDNINYGPAPLPGTAPAPVLGNNIDRGPAAVPAGPATGSASAYIPPASVVPVFERPVVISSSTRDTIIPVTEQAVDINPINTPAATTTATNQQRYITVLANGVVITNNATTLNFTGNGVSVSNLGTSGANIVISGSSGSNYSNSNVSAFLAAFGSNVVSTTGNVTAGYVFGNYIFGNIQAADGNGSVQFNKNGVLGAAAGFNFDDTDGALFVKTLNGAGDPVSGTGGFYAGPAGYTQLGSTVLGQFTGNVNSYAQVNLQNISAGNRSSADYVITGNNGTDTTYYLDLGLASSNHADPAFFGDTSTANDGYLYVVGNAQAGPAGGVGNLILGSTNGVIKMFVGNTAQANVIATVSSTGMSVAGNVTGGNIRTAGLITATGNITGNYILGNGSQLTGISAGANTGNVTFNDVNIIGTGNLNLQPNGSASEYLNIYLTGAADIHVAYGGGSGNVILGTDEEANVAVLQGGNVAIQAGNVAGTKTWTFDTAGNLTLPMGSVVYETNIPDGALSGSAIALKPTGGTTANQQLLIYPTANDGDHIHMTSGNLYTTELFLGSDNFYVKLANTGNVVINSNDGNSSNAMWTFGTDGTTTFPTGNITSGTSLQFTTTFANVKTVEYQTAGVWDLYVEDSITGSNTAASRLNVSFKDNLIDKPQVYIENTKESDGVALRWTFDENGNLTTPSNLVIGPGPGNGSSIFQYNEGLQILGEGANSVVQLGWTANTSAPGSVTTIAMNYPGGGEGNVLIAVGNNATTVNYWLFDNTGNLRLPGNTFAVNYANGTAVSLGGSYGNAEVVANLAALGTNPVSTTGNVTGGNLLFGSGIISGTGNITGGNLDLSYMGGAARGNLTGGNISVTGNITGGNIITAGLLSTTGNVRGGNILTAGAVSASSTITGANLATGGTVSATGNVQGGNIVTGGLISATGNITTAGNILNQGLVSSTGNAIHGNILTGGLVSAAGNITASNVFSSATMSTGGNIFAALNISATGTVYGSNFNTTGLISAGGNVTVGNLLTAGVASATGNIVTAGNFVGNGAALSNVTVSVAGNIIGTQSNVTLVAGAYSWTFNNAGNLTLPGNTFAVNYANNTPVDVVTRFESSWTVPVGNSTQSFTVTASNTYYMWVDCNIPNGILVWNATGTVTNTNVPVVGYQYAWVYNGGGTPIDFTSIPNQFIGTANAIVRGNVSPSATTNRFDFGINNTSGGNVTVRYGWVAIS